MKKVCNRTKTIIIVGIVLIALCAAAAAVLNYSSKPKPVNTATQSEAKPDCVHDETYVEPEPKIGKYYLNGDKNNYYFEILEGHKIQLVGDLYEIFSKWNPQNEEAVKDDVESWSSPRDFKVMTFHKGNDKPLIAVDWEFDESGELVKLASGPVMADENTLTSWGIEGDFIFVE